MNAVLLLVLGALGAAVLILLWLLLRLRAAGQRYTGLETAHRAQLAQQAAAAEQEQHTLRAEHQQQLARFQAIVDVEAERLRIQDATAAERQQVLAQLDAARQRTETEQRRLAETDAQRQRILADLRAKEAVLHADQQRLLAFLDAQRTEADVLQQRLQQLRTDLRALDEQADLQGFGFYQPRYSFDTSVSYQLELQHIREQQKRMIAAKTAATCEAEWTVNGSVAEGRKQTNQTLKLMLRAFNGECDAAVAKVKYNNVAVMGARIRKAYEVVNSLVVVQPTKLSFTACTPTLGQGTAL